MTMIGNVTKTHRTSRKPKTIQIQELLKEMWKAQKMSHKLKVWKIKSQQEIT